jgi:hypothetical protein
MYYANFIWFQIRYHKNLVNYSFPTHIFSKKTAGNWLSYVKHKLWMCFHCASLCPVPGLMDWSVASHNRPTVGKIRGYGYGSDRIYPWQSLHLFIHEGRRHTPQDRARHTASGQRQCRMKPKERSVRQRSTMFNIVDLIPGNPRELPRPLFLARIN